MAYKSEYTGKPTPLCGCGCGKHVSTPTAKHLPGHYNRTQAWRDNLAAKLSRPAIVNTCEECGKEFVAIKYHRHIQQFCSRRCANLSRNEHIVKTCLNCSTEYRITEYRAANSKTVYCSLACKLEWRAKQRRENPRKNSKYRLTAYEDHGRTCTQCGYNAVPPILIVHHIDHDRTNNAPENLTVLCPNCHAVEHLRLGNRRLGPSARNRRLSAKGRVKRGMKQIEMFG